MVHPNLMIMDSQNFLEGQDTWVIVTLQGSQFGVMTLYVPHSKRRQKELWIQIKSRTQNGDWILTRYFNMMEDWLDSFGPSPLIRGSKLLEWRLLVSRFDFINIFPLLGKVEGSQITKRRMPGTCLDQSCIDQIYILGAGWWPH